MITRTRVLRAEYRLCDTDILPPAPTYNSEWELYQVTPGSALGVIVVWQAWKLEVGE